MAQNKIKTKDELDAMRTGGQMLASVLNILKQRIKAGMTTQQLAEIAESELAQMGGKPAFLNYQGFPSVLCVSVNDEVVHGIPGQRVIEPGDIVGMDFGVIYKGMITDGAITVIVEGGPSSPEANKLVKVTEEALLKGVAQVKAGCRVGDISEAIQTHLQKHGFGVVRELVGHGVGHALHESPNIPNFGQKGVGPVLKAGMTIAIEPMSTLGAFGVSISDDGWTVRTRDGQPSAHFEQTILVTDTGHEVLTKL